MLDGQSAAHLSCKPLVSCWEEMLAHVWPRLKGYPSVQIPFSGWFEPLTCQNDRRAARPWCGRCSSGGAGTSSRGGLVSSVSGQERGKFSERGRSTGAIWAECASARGVSASVPVGASGPQL